MLLADGTNFLCSSEKSKIAETIVNKKSNLSLSICTYYICFCRQSSEETYKLEIRTVYFLIYKAYNIIYCKSRKILSVSYFIVVRYGKPQTKQILSSIYTYLYYKKIYYNYYTLLLYYLVLFSKYEWNIY